MREGQRGLLLLRPLCFSADECSHASALDFGVSCSKYQHGVISKKVLSNPG
jgi:hypothetical protein